MTTRLRDLRESRGWSQRRLVVELETRAKDLAITLPGRTSLLTMLSRWEHGAAMSAPYQELFAAALGVGPDELDARLPAQRGDLDPPRPVPRHVSPELLVCLEDQFAAYARTDNRVGPRQIVAAVVAQARQVEALLGVASPSHRSRVLELCVRHAEFAGWVSQDAGELMAAEHWTARALDYAEELGDPLLRAYVLVRKSHLATDVLETQRAVSLANAALRDPGPLPLRMQALGLRQQAVALGLAGEARAAAAAIDASLAAVASDEADQHGLLAYCTPSYILMEGARSWLVLGQPARAVGTLRHSLGIWPTGFARDQGLATARLARALLATRDVEEACAVGREAAAIAAVTASARIAAELRGLRHALAPFARSPEVARLREELRILL